MNDIIGIIPARFASTRFPGKPLVDVAGKTMIQRVYEQSRSAKTLARVIVATDDNRIEKCVKDFGGEVCMTSPDHQSGTDRCAEVVTKLGLKAKAYINIQGDEPFIDPRQIDLLSGCFNDPRTEIATLIKKIESEEVLFNPNSPKVIIDKDDFAIYFSRQPLPFVRGAQNSEWLKRHEFFQHIGIYGYTAAALKHIAALRPSSLEKAESLEQLRWLENGLKVKTAVTDLKTIAIDTPEDLQNVLNDLKGNKK